MKLKPRLMACAKMVELGTGKVVDAGTDHAYLPIYLVKNGIVKSALALDCLNGPLENAKRNIKKYGLEEQIRVRLSEGLSNVDKEEADTIIISGMGSENIINIIENAQWIKSDRKTLILQPMTKDYILRKYLVDNSFFTLKEEIVVDSGKVYLVLKTKYRKNCTNGSKIINDIIKHKIYPYVGTLLLNDKINKETKIYIERQVNKLKKMLKGVNINKNITKYENLQKIINKLDILLKFHKYY